MSTVCCQRIEVSDDSCVSVKLFFLSLAEVELSQSSRFKVPAQNDKKKIRNAALRKSHAQSGKIVLTIENFLDLKHTVNLHSESVKSGSV